MKRLYKGLSLFLLACVLTLSSLAINPDNASAATVGGEPQSTATKGFIYQADQRWLYNFGTAWTYPGYSGQVEASWSSDTENETTRTHMVYLERWTGSSWVRVAHTGNFDSGVPITTNFGGYESVEFRYEYGGVPLKSGSSYRLQFDNQSNTDWVNTDFVQF
jgi:hypothetical protein